ncbi:MAG: cation:proton antiporter [Dehalococcoidia bacterium]
MESENLSVVLVGAATAALIGGFLARRLGQSTLTGFIVAGFITGILPIGPGEGDVDTLADIGVVLLMFSLGVQFDLRELASVRRVALPGAAIQVPLTLLIGLAVAVIVGWTWQEGAFFGAAAAISGGTVLSKLLSERGEEDTSQGRIAVGWSVAQDMGTVALVVLLAALAGEASLTSLAGALGLAAVFLIGMVLLGNRLLPWFLDLVARENSRELFVLALAVLAIGAALLSESAGFSLALGAFVAGLVISEADLSAQILGELLPVRDIFAALFFVAIGLLVDPHTLVDAAPIIVVFTAVTLLVKAGLISGLCVLLGRTWDIALLVGASLAASAEFSFILARLGVDEGVLSEEHFEVIVAATAASIVLASAMYAPIPFLLRWLKTHPQPHEDINAPVIEARTHVVICGYGRVGSFVAETLRRRGYRYVVIDQDRRIVEQLRAEGVDAIYGSCTHPQVLGRARLERARTLLLALPDPITTRLAATHARELNPRLDIVARVRSRAEALSLRHLGVSEAVIAEREVALELTRHTLHRLGMTTMETLTVIQALRARESLGATERAEGTPGAAVERTGEAAAPPEPPRRTPRTVPLRRPRKRIDGGSERAGEQPQDEGNATEEDRREQ